MQSLIIQKQQEFISLLNEACLKELFEVEVYVPQLKEKILKASKWAFGMKDSNPTHGYPQYSTTPISSYEDRKAKVAQINMSQIFEAEKFINSFQKEFVSSPMFNDIVYKETLNAFSTIYLDDVDVEVKTKVNVYDKLYLDEFFKNFTPILTLPPCEEIFDIEDNTPEWLWEIITAYEEWTWKMRKILHIEDCYMQIGGHCCLVQSAPQHYIGQVNNDVGDAGSVAIEYSETTGKIEGYVDMY